MARTIHGVLNSGVNVTHGARGRSRGERPLFISDNSYPQKSALGWLDGTLLAAQAKAGVQPWHSVDQAQNGANHDYVFNHTSGPDEYRGAKADLLFATGPLDWDGAVNLWQYLDYAVHHGGVLDFKGEPRKTEDTVNKIIAASGIPSELGWSFYTNLDRIARESGNSSLLNPKLTEIQSPKPEPTSVITSNFWPLVGVALVGLAITAYIAHET